MPIESTPAKRINELAQEAQAFFEEVRGGAQQCMALERVDLASTVTRATSDG